MIFPSLNSAHPATLSSSLCFLLVAAPPRLFAPGSLAGGSYNVTGQREGGAGLEGVVQALAIGFRFGTEPGS